MDNKKFLDIQSSYFKSSILATRILTLILRSFSINVILMDYIKYLSYSNLNCSYFLAFTFCICIKNHLFFKHYIFSIVPVANKFLLCLE